MAEQGGNNSNMSERGQQGGSKNTPAQQKARKRNIKKAQEARRGEESSRGNSGQE